MSYILRSKEVTTRKAHRCFGCDRMFPSGTEMLCETVKDDNVFTAYFCGTCQKVMRTLEPGEDIFEGALYEDAVELEASKE